MKNQEFVRGQIIEFQYPNINSGYSVIAKVETTSMYGISIRHAVDALSFKSIGLRHEIRIYKEDITLIGVLKKK